MYFVQDAQNQTVLTIEGPVCICQGPCCTWDQEFIVSLSHLSLCVTIYMLTVMMFLMFLA